MNNKIKNIFYIFLPIVLGSLIGMLISNHIDYSTLIKPPLAPPKILFPIAWSIIYLLMGISYYLYKKEDNYDNRITITYYLQLFVNLLWSIIFFIFKARLFASLWIILLDLLVIYLIYLFKNNNNKISAYLNIPYLIWILFATYLTIGIYYLN